LTGNHQRRRSAAAERVFRNQDLEQMSLSVVLVKILVTVLIVVGLSVVAEHVSPRVAGLLSGYPLGAAIALFFIGWELGPDFAADSAVYTLAGLVGSLCFVYMYFRTAAYVARCPIVLSSMTATTGYFAVIGLLETVHLPKSIAVLLSVTATGVFIFLFRGIPNSRIERAIRLTPGVLLLRALLAAGIILAITGAAGAVGPRWAGLFSAFPTTLFPLIIIVHATYGREHVFTVIKNFPRGLGSLILYALSVSLVYPRYGVIAGSLLALAAATIYLMIYSALVARFEK
jgi:hypothetical protein